MSNQKSNIAGATNYANPTIFYFEGLGADPATAVTQGGEDQTVTIYGRNFGPIYCDPSRSFKNKNGVGSGADAWYPCDCANPGVCSADSTGSAGWGCNKGCQRLGGTGTCVQDDAWDAACLVDPAKRITKVTYGPVTDHDFLAQDCKVTKEHEQVVCNTVFGPNFAFPKCYTGACSGTAGSTTCTTDDDCPGALTCDVTGGTEIPCTGGAGKNMGWEVIIDTLISEAATTSYGVPTIGTLYKGATGTNVPSGAGATQTDGGELIRIGGTNFGPVVTPSTFTEPFLSKVTYGPVGEYYEAANCKVVDPGHTLIHCDTVAGVGENLKWMVTVQGQTNDVTVAGPATMTSYAKPTINGKPEPTGTQKSDCADTGVSSTCPGLQVQNYPALNANGNYQGPTAGGNEVIVTGLNFGLADEKAKQQIIFDDWGGGFEASPLEPSEVIPGKKQVVFILPEWYGTGKKVYIKLTPPHSGPSIKSVTPIIFGT